MHYLKLIRVQNLLFLIFIQYSIQQFVIAPLLRTYAVDVSGNSVYLFLLITATTLIAAGGYVLNDYFDVKIDALNKPGKLIIGKLLTRQFALVLYQVLSAAGIFGGLILSYMLKSYTLAFIFIVTPGLLWFYSASYKRQFMTGNIVVAMVAGLAILIIPITQTAILEQSYGLLIYNTSIPKQLYLSAAGFAVFSFLLTWIREIIKDMEDEYGDRELECRTMPIVWGISKTRVFTILLSVLTIGLLLFINFNYISFPGTLTLRYLIFGIIIPLIIMMILLIRAKEKHDFSNISGLCKFIMLVGTLYAPVFYFLLAKNSGIPFFNLIITP